MSKYAIATFIVCWIDGFICYLIGYMVGRTHAKRTITHECVKTNADQHVQRVEYVGNVKRCRKCKHIESEHQTPIASDGKYYTYVVCMASECNYEPKTEPTISKMEQVEITADDFNEDDESCENCRWFNPMKSLGCNLDEDECYYSPKDEPQTERSE